MFDGPNRVRVMRILPGRVSVGATISRLDPWGWGPVDAQFEEVVSHRARAGRVARVSALLFAMLLGSSCGGGGGGDGGGGNGGGGGNQNDQIGIAAVVLSFPTGAAPPGFVSAGRNSGAVVQVVNRNATAPITNASVSVNGTNLPYIPATQEYEGELDISPGATVTVRVEVGGATYSVTQNQFSAYPTIVAPIAGDTWSEVRQNLVRWSATPPRSTTRYGLGVFDTGGSLIWPSDGLQDLPGTDSEYLISVHDLTAGEGLVLLGFVESYAISDTIAGSGLVLGGFNYVPVTIVTASETLEEIQTSPEVATVGLNSSRHIAATGRYADGSRQDVSTEATWTSSDPSKVAVDANGLVTGLSVGGATITAELDGYSASTVVTVFVPVPSPAPPLGQSVAYQIDYAHSGRAVFEGPLTFPPGPAWSITLNGRISYPVIAGDKVYVTTGASSTGLGDGASLYALDLATGNVLWGPVEISTSGFWSGHALDQGRLFVLNIDGELRSFSAATGALEWSIMLQGGQPYSAPPTAANGIVYVGGAARLNAVEAATGKVLWSSEVASGDFSSPAVSGDGVFVSYPCHAYKFDLYSGESLWHYDDGCAGGGGTTTVYANGELFARRTTSMGQDRIFNADTGTIAGPFESDVAPAFTESTGFFLHDGTLQAIDQASRNSLWTFVGDNALLTAPIVINDTVVIGSYLGTVFALDASNGNVVWSGAAGGQIERPGEQTLDPVVGLGAGEGYLVVPAGNRLTAWQVVP